MDNKTRANQIFAMNPEQKEVHICVDGMAFFDDHTADDHQRKLGGKGKYETFKYEDSDYGKEVEAKKKGNKNKNSKPKDATPKQLSELKFDELKAVAQLEKVDVTGLKSKKEVAAKIQEQRDALAAKKIEVVLDKPTDPAQKTEESKEQ